MDEAISRNIDGGLMVVSDIRPLLNNENFADFVHFKYQISKIIFLHFLTVHSLFVNLIPIL